MSRQQYPAARRRPVWMVVLAPLALIPTALLTAPYSDAANYTGESQNPVCAYLDARPTVAGVEDLVAIAVVNGMDPYDAGVVIGEAVVNFCPRHLLTLDAYVAKWGN